MRLALTGRHLDITPALRTLVDVKLAKLERLLSDSAVSAQAVLAMVERVVSGIVAEERYSQRWTALPRGFGRPAGRPYLERASCFASRMAAIMLDGLAIPFSAMS